jgi:hypothetical protein
MPSSTADSAAEHPHEDPIPRPDRGPHDVPWFLRAGRAGLAPEAVTVNSEPGTPNDPAAGLPAEAGADIAGSPPWAAEPADQDLDAPPPWESGPWPSRGPTEVDADPVDPRDWPADGDEAAAHQLAVQAADEPHAYRPQPSGHRPQPSGHRPQPSGHRPQPSGHRPEAPAGNGLAVAALVAGIVGILVVPGVVLGVLGLRRARVTGIGLVQSSLGIALSLVWAVGIIIVVSLPGQKPSSADPGCTAYQDGGRAAAARVSAALSAGGPAGPLRAELRQTADIVNSAAARAQGLTVRSALSGMTGDLQAALGEVTAGRPVSQALKASLSSDTAAAARMCGGSAS